MLRTSLRTARAIGSRPAASAAAAQRQWQPAVARSAARRCFADDAPKPPKLPSSETTTAASSEPPALKTEPQIPASEVPRAPPAPAAAAPPAPKKKGFFRRLRNYLATLILLGAISFGGGLWYSRIDDRFHDFFTEFVPFGEQAVLYLEELEFQKRYPRPQLGGSRNKDTSEQVKIGPQSGASWRVADSGEPAGRQSSSALRDVVTGKKTASAPEPQTSAQTEAKSHPESATTEKKSAVKAAQPAKSATTADAKDVKNANDKKSGSTFVPPQVDEPSRFPPASPLDPLKINDAEEPVVQELVKMLNDIITVVNADNADERFSSTIYKAKDELNKVGSQIRAMKSQAEEEAAKQVKAKLPEFEQATQAMLNRVETAMAAQEAQWRHEFESEMKRVREAYEARFQNETERQALVNEEKLKNQLLEQAVQLKRHFLTEVQGTVETEREARLGKLDQLSSAVRELEQLTTGWNDVVDLNLKTQQLHVAVEAVRGSLGDDEHPRPFVRELVALKEIASDDPVVNAAIASINPTAYQRGIATSSQLIDRFRRVANEVRKASLLPDDAGVASHASSWALSKVLFKKQGLAVGDDVESILTRTQTLLEEGNLDAAAREMNGLQGWAKTLSRDWLGEVRKVLEVQQALDVIATESRLQSLTVE